MARELGKTLGELWGRKGGITHREYVVWQYYFRLEQEALKDRKKSEGKSGNMHRRLKDPRTESGGEVPKWDQETMLQYQKAKWFGMVGINPKDLKK